MAADFVQKHDCIAGVMEFMERYQTRHKTLLSAFRSLLREILEGQHCLQLLNTNVHLSYSAHPLQDSVVRVACAK